MGWILDTSPSLSFVFLRLGLAVTFFLHSTQQIFGWHGGRGLKAHLANWRDRQGIPIPIGALGVFIEFFGSLALLIGFLTRPFAFGLALFIGISLIKSKAQHCFLQGRRPGEHSGIEYTLALFLMAMALLVGGGGALSVDGLISR